MAVWFTSDTHFGDAPRFRVERRPFASVEAMDEALVQRWNEVVGEADEIWHLGDFAFGPPRRRIAELIGALRGTKHLIIGNNDGPDTIEQPGWASVGHYAEIEVEGRLLVLFHYALRTWNGMGRGAINLHGHSHGRLAPLPRQYDVGVDVWDFRPIGLATILRRRRSGPPRPRAAAARAAAARAPR